MKIYQKIAQAGDALQRCIKTGNSWADRWQETLDEIENNYLPSGSGFDSGCSIERADGKKIVIAFSYHNMNENGSYDGWSDYELIVTPNLALGYDMRFTGKDRNGNKEYFGDEFSGILDMEYTE